MSSKQYYQSILESIAIVVQLLGHVQLFGLSHPMNCNMPALLSSTISWSLFKFISIESVMLPDHLILCLPLLLLPSVFPSIKIFSNELSLPVRGLKYWSFNFSISSFKEYSGLISLRIDWFDLLQPKGLSRVFSSTTVRKHQFFGAPPSLWSNSHSHTTGKTTSL